MSRRAAECWPRHGAAAGGSACQPSAGRRARGPPELVRWPLRGVPRPRHRGGSARCRRRCSAVGGAPRAAVWRAGTMRASSAPWEATWERKLRLRRAWPRSGTGPRKTGGREHRSPRRSAREAPSSRPREPAGELRDEGGLSLAGLTRHEDDLSPLARGTAWRRRPRWPARSRGRSPRRPGRCDRRPAEEPGRARQRRPRTGSQPTSSVLDGLGQALEFECSERGEGVGASPTSVGSHQVGGRIWPPSARAQSRAASMTGSPK